MTGMAKTASCRLQRADAVVQPGSQVDGQSIGELKLHTETGMEVLAIQRSGRWTYRPRRGFTLQQGDRLLAIGPEEGAPRLRAVCGDERPESEDGWIEPVEEVEA
jgi:uncharacterized protein with PhoU and TrkA domain